MTQVEKPRGSSLSAVGARRTATYWRSPRAGIGVIFGREDEPREMQRKERANNVLVKQAAREQRLVKRRYMVNHPVVQLLEKNLKNIDVNEIFINDKGFNVMKGFQGLAMLGSADPRANLLDEISSLSVKQNMNMKQRLAKTSVNTTFYM